MAGMTEKRALKALFSLWSLKIHSDQLISFSPNSRDQSNLKEKQALLITTCYLNKEMQYKGYRNKSANQNSTN